MDPEILRGLQARRREIRAHWETLLRLERVSSPLAQPDTLVHLLDTTLEEIFQHFVAWSPGGLLDPISPTHCPCGRNPLLAYFAAGRQALRDALIQAQSLGPAPAPPQRDRALACVDEVFSRISSREVAAFCALCQFREREAAILLGAGGR